MLFDPPTVTAVSLQAVKSALESCPVGGTISYKDIEGLSKVEILKKRYLVARAISSLNKDCGAVFVSVYRVGYRRLPPAEAHALGASARLKIYRTAGRSKKRIVRALCFANDIPQQAAIQANREVAMLGLIQHAAHERQMKHTVTESESPKPVADVLKEMLNKI